jgi:hypothetical protein
MVDLDRERRQTGWLLAALLAAGGICVAARAGESGPAVVYGQAPIRTVGYDYPPYYRPWYASPYQSYGSYYRPWYASPWAYSLYRPSYHAAPYYNGPYYAWPRYYRHEEVYAWPCPPEAVELLGPEPLGPAADLGPLSPPYAGYGGCYYW